MKRRWTMAKVRHAFQHHARMQHTAMIELGKRRRRADVAYEAAAERILNQMRSQAQKPPPESFDKEDLP